MNSVIGFLCEVLPMVVAMWWMHEKKDRAGLLKYLGLGFLGSGVLSHLGARFFELPVFSRSGIVSEPGRVMTIMAWVAATGVAEVGLTREGVGVSFPGSPFPHCPHHPSP